MQSKFPDLLVPYQQITLTITVLNIKKLSNPISATQYNLGIQQSLLNILKLIASSGLTHATAYPCSDFNCVGL